MGFSPEIDSWVILDYCCEAWNLKVDEVTDIVLYLGVCKKFILFAMKNMLSTQLNRWLVSKVGCAVCSQIEVKNFDTVGLMI